MRVSGSVGRWRHRVLPLTAVVVWSSGRAPGTARGLGVPEDSSAERVPAGSQDGKLDGRHLGAMDGDVRHDLSGHSENKGSARLATTGREVRQLAGGRGWRLRPKPVRPLAL